MKGGEEAGTNVGALPLLRRVARYLLRGVARKYERLVRCGQGSLAG